MYCLWLTCYRGVCSPSRSFSCRTCSRSCAESRCAATQDSSLCLQSKERPDEFDFKAIPHCHVSRRGGSSDRRSRCMRSDVSGRRSGRRDNASLRGSLRKTDFSMNRHFHSHRGVVQRQHTVCLGGRRTGPLLDAVQVEDVETALAAPHGGHEPDDVAANHALVLLLRQLLDQTACQIMTPRTSLVAAQVNSQCAATVVVIT